MWNVRWLESPSHDRTGLGIGHFSDTSNENKFMSLHMWSNRVPGNCPLTRSPVRSPRSLVCWSAPSSGYWPFQNQILHTNYKNDRYSSRHNWPRIGPHPRSISLSLHRSLYPRRTHSMGAGIHGRRAFSSASPWPSRACSTQIEFQPRIVLGAYTYTQPSKEACCSFVCAGLVRLRFIFTI